MERLCLHCSWLQYHRRHPEGPEAKEILSNYSAHSNSSGDLSFPLSSQLTAEKVGGLQGWWLALAALHLLLQRTLTPRREVCNVLIKEMQHKHPALRVSGPNPSNCCALAGEHSELLWQQWELGRGDLSSPKTSVVPRGAEQLAGWQPPYSSPREY